MTDMNTAPPPAGIRVGEVLSRTFGLLSGDFAKFFLLALITSSPWLLFALLGLTSAPNTAATVSAAVLAVESSGGVLLLAVVAILGQAAILYGAIQKMRGQDFTIGASLGRGLARFFPIIGLIFCMIVGVGVGLVLLVIPGVILLFMWYVALPVCVVERLGPIGSLKRSAYLTKGNRWRILVTIVAIYIVNGIVQNIVQAILFVAGGMTVAMVGTFVWMSLFSSFSSLVTAVLYHDLRVAREGVDINQIAAVFD
jgi:hypothetical protein